MTGRYSYPPATHSFEATVERKQTSPLSDRFWSRVRKTSQCWEWTGGTTSFGHGRIRVTNRRTGERFLVSPHRVSYLLNVGDIPVTRSYHGLCVCHHCDNPKCVRPDHLFLGTQKQNANDASSKGRLYKFR